MTVRPLVAVAVSAVLVGALSLFVMWVLPDVRVPQPGYPCLVVEYRGRHFKAARFERSRLSGKVILTMPTPQPPRNPPSTMPSPLPPATTGDGDDGFDPRSYYPEPPDPKRGPRILELSGYDVVADSESCSR